LYDVHDDPLEEWELSADRAAEVRRMRARLAALELAP
jgi:flagellar motor protein MotB